MRIYAEHFVINKDVSYRRKTLLRFGDGSNLIGSIVLLNPGSARPQEKVNDGFVKHFYGLNFNEKVNENDWYAFSADPTMIQVEKLFNGYYVGEQLKLDGVVQLFNCFYYRNQDLDKALQFDWDNAYIFDEYKYLKDKPIYFGWGNAGKDSYIKSIAKDIFDKCDRAKANMYNSVFEKNKFYHPRYINMSYLRNDHTKKLVRGFWDELKY